MTKEKSSSEKEPTKKDDESSDNQNNISPEDEEKKAEYLQDVREELNYQLDSLLQKRTEPDDLLNLAFSFEELGMNDLRDRVYSEALPKAIILSVQEAIGFIDENSEINRRKLNAYYSVIGHKVRAGAMPKMSPMLGTGDKTVNMAALKLCAESGALMREYAWAGNIFRGIGDQERAEEMEALAQQQSEPFGEDWEYLETHASEIGANIRKAYTDFIETVKDTKKFNVNLDKLRKDLEEFYKEILAQLDDK